MKIPDRGWNRERIFKTMEAYRAQDVPWKNGRTWGYIYDPGEKAMEVAKEAFMMFLTENALDPTVYPSLLRFENELVAMAADHVGGDERVVGNFTSGGTESILMAVKASRDYFREQHGIRNPEMILPSTAHASFHKAAQYFDVRLTQVPVDPKTFRADVAGIRRAVTPRTILLVGSAPSYAHGVVDPIRELGELALEKGLWLHVDACVGGFMLPYFRRLGAAVPDFDFSVPGVTSLSMDLHKYAYTPKGASLILYRNKEFRKYQIFSCASWPGYTMVNNVVQSSKSGGPMAAAWAALMFIGDQGYMEMARRQYEATRRIAEGIERIDGLRLMAEPDMCMLSFTSDTVSVFQLIDAMRDRGWYIQPQFAYGNSKENIHLSVSASNVPRVDEFLEDLEACVAEAANREESGLAETLSRQLGGVKPGDIDEGTLARMLEMAGLAGGVGLPNRMAPINEVLNALDPAIRERLLTLFVNDLFIYRQED